jgi:hypothetical protein
MKPLLAKHSLLLHIGTEKTGTTSIQDWLSSEAAFLRELGVHPLISSWGGGNFRELAAAFSDADDYFLSDPDFTLDQLDFRQAQLREQILQKISESKAASGKSWYLISSEHLSSRVTTIEQIGRLSRFLSLQFERVLIIVAVRDQATLMESAWSTAVRSGSPVQLGQTPDEGHLSNSYFNLKILLSSWVKVFGRRRIVVVNYAHSAGRPRGILGDFARVIDTLTKLGLPKEGLEKPRLNQRLGYREASTLRLFNELTGGLYASEGGINRASELKRRAYDRMQIADAASPSIRVDRTAWREAFRESNAWVERKFKNVGSIFPDNSEFYIDTEAEARAQIDREIEGLRILFGPDQQ